METENKTEQVSEPTNKEDLILQSLKRNILLLKDAELDMNVNYVMRVLLFTSDIRKNITLEDLCNTIHESISDQSPCKSLYLNAIQSVLNNDGKSENKSEEEKSCVGVEIYLGTLLCNVLLRCQYLEASYSLCTSMIDLYKTVHSTIADILLSRTLSFFNILCERMNRLKAVRDFVLSLYRNACLHNNTMEQAVLYNMILCIYIHNREYESASIFLNRSIFPVSASDKQYTRYLYYKGLVECIQLEYSNSLSSLQKALRALDSTSFHGIQSKIHKIYILVQLLMGDIPDRHLFNNYIHMSTNPYSNSMIPYYYLTQIVRIGDIQGFNKHIDAYKSLFLHDGTYFLILRLRSSVLRLALRQIYLSYSRISIQEIAQRLSVEPEEAEFICTRAIRDQVIHATINHEQGYLTSKDMITNTVTEMPRKKFQERIKSLLEIKHEVLKSKQ